MYWRDEWPTTPDGTEWDVLNLLELVRAGESPFASAWDADLLIREIEENMEAQVVDIPLVSRGSNNYGIQMTLSDGQDIVARLARGDVNKPDFEGFSVESQIAEIKFEAEVYDLLRDVPGIKASRLLYHRAPALCRSEESSIPESIVGRRLMVFKRDPGRSSGIWRSMTVEQQLQVVDQAADIRVALFNFALPDEFASRFLLERLFEQKPMSLPLPVASTRDFCVALFTSKIESTIGNIGDMIGWEDDGNTVGPIAAAAKQSLLKFVPHMLPFEAGSENVLYRLVLEHGDFGIHNMAIDDQPSITSLFDWETGLAGADLITDGDGQPALKRVKKDASIEEVSQHATCTTRYHQALFQKAPDYQRAIQAGKDARHLWFALRNWRGDDSEGYFGKLGSWAEQRLRELS